MTTGNGYGRIPTFFGQAAVRKMRKVAAGFGQSGVPAVPRNRPRVQRTRSVLCITELLLFVSASLTYGWGYEAHRMINRAALSILPPDMLAMTGPHVDALVEHAADPDLWKDDPDERPRHYIDLELGDAGGPPYGALTRDYAGAVAALGADSVKKMGVLPWRIESYFETLVNSMSSPSDSTLIVMAALGHYVADAHMPLHTTVNYDGQFTGNRGVHFRFEWWMIEQHREKIALDPHLPFWIYDPLDAAWRIILRSHADIDTLLSADTDVRRTFRQPMVNELGRGVADPEYDQRLWERLGGIAVDRMTRSAEAVAGYWYAAWLRAGRPDLKSLPTPPPPPSAE